MKFKINSLITEGILFCGSGLWLLSYSVSSYRAAFNKDWTQSPFLFPLIVAAALIGLSLSLLIKGIMELHKSAAEKAEAAVQKSVDTKAVLRIAGILAFCILYYFALKTVRLPAVTFGIFDFFFTVSNFEILTFVFLLANMLFLGVRKWYILLFVPMGTVLFFCIAFRTLLHVLLP